MYRFCYWFLSFFWQSVSLLIALEFLEICPLVHNIKENEQSIEPCLGSVSRWKPPTEPSAFESCTKRVRVIRIIGIDDTRSVSCSNRIRLLLVRIWNASRLRGAWLVSPFIVHEIQIYRYKYIKYGQSSYNIEIFPPGGQLRSHWHLIWLPKKEENKFESPN
jgi:hypothetical protein